MEVFLAILLYGIVGTVIGRILFVRRLADADRYAIASRDHRDWGGGGLKKGDPYQTATMDSAQLYGLWAIPLWPLVLAFYIVQAPTREEKQKVQKQKAATLLKEFDLKSLVD